MSMSEELRRELLKALYSAERLFHSYKRASFFHEQPARYFLNTLWHTVETGEAPPSTLGPDIASYIQSDKVPAENRCFGIDRYGYDFIRVLETLSNFLDGRNPRILNLVYLDVETDNIDQIVIDLTIAEGETLLVTQEVREAINSHPLMTGLSRQLEIDAIKAQEVDLTPTGIQASKLGSVHDITLWDDPADEDD